MIVGTLTTLLGFQVNNSGMVQYERDLARARQLADITHTAIGTATGYIFGRVLYDAASIIVRVTQKVGQGIAEIARAGDEMTNSINKVSVAITATENATEFYERLYRLSLDTGVATEKTVDIFNRFAIASQRISGTSTMAVELTEIMQKVGIVAGATSQEIASMNLQLGQGLASNRLQGDEFRSLREAAPRLMQELANEMNIPYEKLREMSTKGLLDAKTVMPALIRAGQTFVEKFDKLPLTMGRAQGQWQVASRRFMADLDKALGLSYMVAQGFHRWAMAIDAARARLSVVKNFVDEMGGLEDMLRLVTIAMSAAFGAGILYMVTMLTAGVNALITRMTILALRASLIGLAIMSWALLLEDLYVWTQGGKSMIGRVLGPFDELGGRIKTAFGPINDEFNALFKDRPQLREFFIWMQSVRTEAEGILKVMESFLKLLSGEIGTGLDGIREGFVQIDSAAGKLLATLGLIVGSVMAIRSALWAITVLRGALAGAGAIAGAGAAAAGGAAAGAAGGAAAAAGGAAAGAAAARIPSRIVRPYGWSPTLGSRLGAMGSGLLGAFGRFSRFLANPWALGAGIALNPTTLGNGELPLDQQWWRNPDSRRRNADGSYDYEPSSIMREPRGEEPSPVNPSDPGSIARLRDSVRRALLPLNGLGDMPGAVNAPITPPTTNNNVTTTVTNDITIPITVNANTAAPNDVAAATEGAASRAVRDYFDAERERMNRSIMNSIPRVETAPR